MIELVADGDVLVARGPAGGRAFADGAWSTPGLLRCVVVRDDGELVGPSGEAGHGFGADDVAAAAAVFYGIADAAVRAAAAARPGPVEVTGSGALASTVRALLEERRLGTTPGSRPSAIVDTTGDPAILAEALERLDDLGSLVLAAPPSDNLDLDLYPDIHVRGLRVVGVRVSFDVVQEAYERGLHQEFLALEHRFVAPGEPVPEAALWLEVAAGRDLT